MQNLEIDLLNKFRNRSTKQIEEKDVIFVF